MKVYTYMLYKCNILQHLKGLKKDYGINFMYFTGILRLPSQLFYNCSLLTRSLDCYPHPNAPHTLMFICSSLEERKSCSNAIDENEAKLLFQKASYYLSRWPDEWGKFSFDEVCIMTRTHQQVKHALHVPFNKIKHSKILMILLYMYNKLFILRTLAKEPQTNN